MLADEHRRTEDPHVFAIGECAPRAGGCTAWSPRLLDGRGRGGHPAGGEGSFTGADMSTSSLLGVDVASFGDAFATTPGSLELVFADAVAGVYKKLVVSVDDDGNASRLLGGILVGDASAYGTLRPMAVPGHHLPRTPRSLILPASRGGAARWGCPTTPRCACNNVTKATICGAVTVRGPAGLRRTSPASRPAPGQARPVGRAGAEEPPRRAARVKGRLVRTGICEHFDLSRQELFDVVAVHGYRTFDDLVTAHGRGRGCDVCKPAVASILASQLNGHVLDESTVALQDTNDAYLANIQRNGTYSVVPRVPGGEITLDRLIVIGEVARDRALHEDHRGQRIDLFGARLEQLPAIWRRLVDAGFESGHAYGKSLRTVKSCVGSTWCRYGVQDSVRLAIDLENRYRPPLAAQDQGRRQRLRP